MEGVGAKLLPLCQNNQKKDRKVHLVKYTNAAGVQLMSLHGTQLLFVALTMLLVTTSFWPLHSRVESAIVMSQKLELVPVQNMTNTLNSQRICQKAHLCLDMVHLDRIGNNGFAGGLLLLPDLQQDNTVSLRS